MKNKLKVKIIPSLVFGLINIVYCQVESKIYESYSDDYVVKAYDAFINDTVYTTGLWCYAGRKDGHDYNDWSNTRFRGFSVFPFNQEELIIDSIQVILKCSSVSGVGSFWWDDIIGNITDTLRFFVTSLPPDSNLLFSDEEAVWNSIPNWNRFYNRPLDSGNNTHIIYNPNTPFTFMKYRSHEFTLSVENALRNGLNLYLGVVIDPEDINNRYIGEGWFRLKIWFHKLALSNRYEQTEDALSGTLSLDHNSSSEYDYSLVNSTDSVFVSVGDSYDIKTNQDSLQYNGDYLFHNNWDHLPQDYFLERNNYIMDSRYTMNAYFDNKYVLSFSHPEIKIQDPWFSRENGIQTGTDWIETNGNYKVFINQNEDFEPDKPINRLKIHSRYYTTQTDLYVFDRWAPHNDVDYGDGINQPSYDFETDVVFKSANAQVTAEYTSVSNAPNYTLTIEENETLTIPSGADITFADNFVINVNGGTLNIQGAKLTGSVNNNGVPTAIVNIDRFSYADIDNSIVKNFAFGFERQRQIANDSINLSHTVFSNVYAQVSGYAYNYPQGINLLDIVNCTWINSYMSIILQGNEVWELQWPLNLTNNIFYNSQFLLQNPWVNIINNHNLYFNSVYYDCNNTCIIDENPNFVDPQYGNYNLSYPSPAIDTGDPNSPLDPDGTRMDMGAYFHDYPPIAPSLTLSGNIGESPFLSWTPGDNQLISHSVLEKKYVTLGGSNIVIVDPVQSPYTDPLMTIGFGRTKAFYEVKDVDPLDQSSPWSNSVVTRGEGGEFNNKEMIPTEYAIHTAFPNPFNPETTIKYDLQEQSQVQLIIFDLLGRKINTLKNKTEEAGWYSIKWDGKDKNGHPFSSGMYIISLSAHSTESEEVFSKSQKVVLLK